MRETLIMSCKKGESAASVGGATAAAATASFPKFMLKTKKKSKFSSNDDDSTSSTTTTTNFQSSTYNTDSSSLNNSFTDPPLTSSTCGGGHTSTDYDDDVESISRFSSSLSESLLLNNVTSSPQIKKLNSKPITLSYYHHLHDQKQHSNMIHTPYETSMITSTTHQSNRVSRKSNHHNHHQQRANSSQLPQLYKKVYDQQQQKHKSSDGNQNSTNNKNNNNNNKRDFLSEFNSKRYSLMNPNQMRENYYYSGFGMQRNNLEIGDRKNSIYRVGNTPPPPPPRPKSAAFFNENYSSVNNYFFTTTTTTTTKATNTTTSDDLSKNNYLEYKNTKNSFINDLLNLNMSSNSSHSSPLPSASSPTLSSLLTVPSLPLPMIQSSSSRPVTAVLASLFNNENNKIKSQQQIASPSLEIKHLKFKNYGLHKSLGENLNNIENVINNNNNFAFKRNSSNSNTLNKNFHSSKSAANLNNNKSLNNKINDEHENKIFKNSIQQPQQQQKNFYSSFNRISTLNNSMRRALFKSCSPTRTTTTSSELVATTQVPKNEKQNILSEFEKNDSNSGLKKNSLGDSRSDGKFRIINIQVEFSLKTGTSTPLFITKKNHNSDTNTIFPLF
jgi:hypothetical protein